MKILESKFMRISINGGRDHAEGFKNLLRHRFLQCVERTWYLTRMDARLERVQLGSRFPEKEEAGIVVLG